MQNNCQKFKNKFKKTNPEFLVYFIDQWLRGPFKHWKIFTTPPGYCATNSPHESFNRAVKRDFKLNKKTYVLKASENLMDAAKYYSVHQDPFELKPIPKLSFIKIAKTMCSKKRFNQIIDGKLI